MSPLNMTLGDVLDGARSCGRGGGADGTPYGVVELALAAGVPSAVLVILLILAAVWYYLEPLRDLLRVILSRDRSGSEGSTSGQDDSFESPQVHPPVGQGPALGARPGDSYWVLYCIYNTCKYWVYPILVISIGFFPIQYNFFFIF